MKQSANSAFSKTKQSNPRRQFFITLLLCALLGAVGGFVTAGSTPQLSSISQWLNAFLQKTSFWFLLAGFVPLAITNLLYLHCRSLKDAALQDEAFYDLLSHRLNVAISMTTLCMIWILSFSAMAFPALLSSHQLLAAIIGVIALTVQLAWDTALQQSCIRLNSLLAPEKPNNCLDNNFQKKFYQSCDEQERQQIGECAYTTFRFMSMIYPVVLVLLMMLSMMSGANNLLILLVGGLWLLHSGSYLLRALKVSRQQMERSCH